MLSKIKNYLQTKWIDRYTPEPVYIQVREDALTSLEQCVMQILADPATQFAIIEEDRLALHEALSNVTGKPRGWYFIFVQEELKRRRRHGAAIEEAASGC